MVSVSVGPRTVAVAVAVSGFVRVSVLSFFFFQVATFVENACPQRKAIFLGTGAGATPEAVRATAAA